MAHAVVGSARRPDDTVIDGCMPRHQPEVHLIPQQDRRRHAGLSIAPSHETPVATTSAVPSVLHFDAELVVELLFREELSDKRIRHGSLKSVPERLHR